MAATTTNEKLKAQYMDAEPGTPQQFAAFMQQELKKWGPVIKKANISLD